MPAKNWNICYLWTVKTRPLGLCLLLLIGYLKDYPTQSFLSRLMKSPSQVTYCDYANDDTKIDVAQASLVRVIVRVYIYILPQYICSVLLCLRRSTGEYAVFSCQRSVMGNWSSRFLFASMEVNSPLYNLEFVGESMEQKDRGSHCCTGECLY